MMPRSNLPVFRYHPDPVRSGSIAASDAVCLSCREARGYVYTGPIYAESELHQRLCPWCIADGAAHRRFDAEFVDPEAFTDELPARAVKEVCTRTPGFSSWQSEQWPVCCDDAAAFLMPAGIADVRREFYEVEGVLMGYIVHEMKIPGGAATQLLDSLHRDAGPTAYVFQCLHCQAHLVYIDHH